MQMELRLSEHVPEWSRVCHVEALFWLAKEQTLKWKDSDYNIIIKSSDTKEETFNFLFSCNPRTTLNNNDVENEAKCKTLLVKMSFYLQENKTLFSYQ